MAIEGYYITCDDAVCMEHYDEEGWEGFEDWEEPIPITDSTTASSPIHCVECGILLDVPLDSYGIDTVYEAIIEDLSVGKRNPVVHQWVNSYGDDIDLLEYYKEMQLDETWSDPSRPDLHKYLDHI